MPNPVAVNDLSPISGSLQTSRISYAVETAGKDYGQDYNGTTWYSDIPQNGSQYTIISDNYTANYYVSRSNAEGAYVEGGLPAVDEYSAPVFWLTAGTSSLDIITIVNGLPDRRGQIPFNSGSQALNWIISSSNYFAVGPPYEQINADSLGLYVNGGQIISYPTTMSAWYDISGQNNRFTLTNGPTYNSSGWINFDGSDDYAVAVNTTLPSNATSSFTLMAVARTSGGGNYQTVLGTGGLFSEIGFYVNNSFMYGRNGGGGGNLYSNGGAITTGRFYHLAMTYNGSTATAYLNGVATQTGVNIGSNGGTNGVHVLSTYTPSAASEMLTGDIAEAYVYTQAISASDVAQSYYGGPIVTSSLLAAYDAGNLVSYPKSGTTVYNLTGSGTGTLTNGVGYNNIYGGTFNFDGADDYINLGQINYTNVTVEGWVFRDDTTDLVNIVSGAGVVQYFGVYSQTLAYYASIDTGGWTFGTTTLQPQTWYHVAITYNDSNYAVKMYLNGNLESTSTANASYRTGYVSTLGTYNNASIRFWKGYISNLRIYGTALTQAQIQQNYNATK